MRNLSLALSCALVLASTSFAQDNAEPAAKMVTRWAKDMNADAPLPEYPRPQLVREKWLNLNGQWDYAIVDGQKLESGHASDVKAPSKWDGKIVVPFCPESILSGVQKRVGEKSRLWYHRTVKLPADWNKDERVL